MRQSRNAGYPFHVHDQVRSRNEDCAQIGSGRAHMLAGLAIPSQHVGKRRGGVCGVRVQEKIELFLPQPVWARITHDTATQETAHIELMKLGLQLVGDDRQRWK